MSRTHGGPSAAERSASALRLALTANSALIVVQIGAGIMFGSLALLADSAHLASDVAALTVALIALRLATRPATKRHTYGLQRAEVLGALVNGAALVAVTVWIVIEAVARLQEPNDVQGVAVLIVGVAGLAVNLGSAYIVGRTRGQSLNMRAVQLHMFADAGGSLAVIVAGAADTIGVLWADPVASLVIAVLILAGSFTLLRDAVNVLLEGTPKGLEIAAITAAIEGDPSVESVHHLHAWNLASDTAALSAHVVIEGETSLHEAQEHGDRIREMLGRRFGIAHATLELECHECDPQTPASGRDPLEAGRKDRASSGHKTHFSR